MSKLTEKLPPLQWIGTVSPEEHPSALRHPGVWSQRGRHPRALWIRPLRGRLWPAPPQRHPGGRLLQSHQGRFQQGQQREPDRGGRQRTTEEDQGYRLPARPEEGSLREAQTAERLRVSLWDVWDLGHGG